MVIRSSLTKARLRPPANLPRNLAYDLYEGIVETDRWFGPLFTNIRLVKTDRPVHFSTEIPLVLGDHNAALPTLDSTRLLARAALRHAVAPR